MINSIRTKRLAFELIGYGGMPSNHSAIVCSMAMLIALKQGVDHPAFGVAITVAFIVMLDANSLRREIGKHAVAINQALIADSARKHLRERMGHTLLEISAGIVVGSVVAVSVWQGMLLF